jgi:hypothetical protein
MVAQDLAQANIQSLSNHAENSFCRAYMKIEYLDAHEGKFWSFVNYAALSDHKGSCNPFLQQSTQP